MLGQDKYYLSRMLTCPGNNKSVPADRSQADRCIRTINGMPNLRPSGLRRLNTAAPAGRSVPPPAACHSTNRASDQTTLPRAPGARRPTLARLAVKRTHSNICPIFCRKSSTCGRFSTYTWCTVPSISTGTMKSALLIGWWAENDGHVDSQRCFYIGSRHHMEVGITWKSASRTINHMYMLL